MSKSQTITAEEWSANPDDWLPNPHAGEMLWLEFMEPGDIGVDDLASAIVIQPDRLAAVIDGKRRMDAELDLRLARYFGMSEGFFLGLQIDYELLEAKRALNGSLDRIVPRAA
jgi:addiction module HigA family antidote